MIFDNMFGAARPLSWVVSFWPVLAASFYVSYIATWLCRKIAIRFGIVDKPDDLVKTHKEPIAYLGGVGMFIGLVVGILAGIFLLNNTTSFSQSLKWLLAILAGSAIACCVGLIDDLLNIKPFQKMFGQLLASIMLMIVDIKPNLDFLNTIFNLSLPPFAITIIEYLTVVFFVLGATNSLNLLDGLDGLCGGVTVIITISMLFLSASLATWGYSEIGDPVRIILCLGLVGCVCGFLPFNRYPAKIFMGDAGSMLLGFMMAAMMLLFSRKIPRWWMASIVVFGLPILDTAVALARRFLNHRPLFVSDRGHIYDQMMDRGYSLNKTVAINYVLAGMYAFIGLAMSQIRTRHATIVYVLVIIISAFIVWKKGYLKMEGLRGAIKK